MGLAVRLLIRSIADSPEGAGNVETDPEPVFAFKEPLSVNTEYFDLAFPALLCSIQKGKATLAVR